MNRSLLVAGVVLLLVGFVANGIFADFGESPFDPFGLGIFGVAALVGIILVFAGALGREAPDVGYVESSGQQQQQQIVVYTMPPTQTQAAAPKLRCPTCSTLNESSVRFCMECGKPFPVPAATPAQRR